MNIEISDLMCGTYTANNFSYPNFYSDRLEYYLSPVESKVLSKVIREILGWNYSGLNNPVRKITLSLLINPRRVGEKKDYLILGCGLGRKAVQKAMHALCEFRIIQRLEKTPVDGYVYRLNLNTDLIDWAGLIARRAQWDTQGQSRIEKMHETQEENTHAD